MAARIHRQLKVIIRVIRRINSRAQIQKDQWHVRKRYILAHHAILCHNQVLIKVARLLILRPLNSHIENHALRLHYDLHRRTSLHVVNLDSLRVGCQ